MSIIAWIVLGAIAGYLAGFLVKGDEGLGVIGHIVLGIVGALVGGFLAGVLFNTRPDRRRARHQLDRRRRPSARSSRSSWSARSPVAPAWVAAPSDPQAGLDARTHPSTRGGPPSRWAFSHPSAQYKEEHPCPRSSKPIDVDVPVRVAYDQWTQFEEFPRFMEGVEKVEQLDDTTPALDRRRSPASEDVDGQDHRADARPAHRLDLDRGRAERRRRDVPPPRRPQDPGHPPARRRAGGPGRVGRRRPRLRPAAGEGDLERFKEFIEAAGVATGAWRGEVRQDDVNG